MAIRRLLLALLWLFGGTPFVTALSLKHSNGLNRRDALSAATCTAGGLLLPSPAAATSTATSVDLPGGISFPLVSFGLQVYDDETAYQLTLTALEVGYRNFFASVLARNQKGFARAVRDSKIPRNELFICGSVVSNRVSSYKEAKQVTTQGWQDNLKAFGVGNIDYLDQIMLDYPAPDAASIRGQWRAFEEMKNEKLVKTLAVSNFSPVQLDCIVNDVEATAKPVVNQLPFSVAYHPAGNSIEENNKRDILVQAWAPLGGSLGGRFNAKIKQKCADIGAQYAKSGAQVALRWIIQSGAAVCTQTKKKEHFVQDLDIFDFELSKQDMDTLDALAG